MMDDPVNLDGRRSLESQMATDFRRHAAECRITDQTVRQQHDAELHRQMLVGPADGWAGAARKAQFLIRRYARTPEAQDARVRKLIRRALSDLARLVESEDQDR